jgi:hypothetical protein
MLQSYRSCNLEAAQGGVCWVVFWLGMFLPSVPVGNTARTRDFTELVRTLSPFTMQHITVPGESLPAQLLRIHHLSPFKFRCGWFVPHPRRPCAG